MAIKIPKAVTSKKPKKRQRGQHAKLTDAQIFQALGKLMLEEQRGPTVKRLAVTLTVHDNTLRSRFPGGIDELVRRLVHYQISCVLEALDEGVSGNSYLQQLLVKTVTTFEPAKQLSRYVGAAFSDIGLTPLFADQVLGALLEMGADKSQAAAAFREILEAVVGRITLQAALVDTTMEKSIHNLASASKGAQFAGLKKAAKPKAQLKSNSGNAEAENKAWAAAVVSRIQASLNSQEKKV